MADLKTATFYLNRWNLSRSAKGDWNATPRQGRSEREVYWCGKAKGDPATGQLRQYRANLDFAFDKTGMGFIHKAELVFYNHTEQQGSEASVRVYRNTNQFPQNTSTQWDKTKSTSPGFDTTMPRVKKVAKGWATENRVNVTPLVGAWLDLWQRWLRADGAWQPGQKQGVYGFTLLGGDVQQKRFAFFGPTHPTTSLRPRLEVTYELPNQPPYEVTGFAPKGSAPRGTSFQGDFSDPNQDSPLRVRVQVVKAGQHSPVQPVWDKAYSNDGTWTDTGGGIWQWTVPNPGDSVLKGQISYDWRCKGFDVGGKSSDWSPWYNVTFSGTPPTVALRSIGTLQNLQGYTFIADWTAAGADRVDSYRIQVKRQGDVWSDNIWDESKTFITTLDAQNKRISFQYGGPNLGPGDYEIRIMVVDNRGVASGWDEEVFVLTVGSEDDTLAANDDGFPPYSTAFKRTHSPCRILLYANDGANRAPGTLKAVIEDAANIGMSQVVNEGGEFFFTLPATHPQAGECEPWQRHWELQQYRRGNWRTIGNGLLSDFDAGDEDIIVYGYDYLGVLAKSVDTRTPNKKDIEATHAKGGAKYVDTKISDVITDQLQQAGAATPDSPLAFFNIGVMHNLNTKITIYSSFKQRLDFIRGLIESHKAGSGVRTRLKPRQDRRRATAGSGTFVVARHRP